MEISTIGLQLFAFWVFKYYGYKDVRIINGGRKKWLIEDRLTTKDIPQYPKGNFIAVTDTDNDIRAFFNYVRGTLENDGGSSNTVELVDVRGPKEFTGEVLSLHQNIPLSMHREGDIFRERRIYLGVKLSMTMMAHLNQQTN